MHYNSEQKKTSLRITQNQDGIKEKTDWFEYIKFLFFNVVKKNHQKKYEKKWKFPFPVLEVKSSMGKIPKNAGMVFKNHLEAQKRYEDGDELLQRSQQNSGALFLLFSGLCAVGVHRGQDPVPEP